jgi:hypothetical protein
MGEERTVEDVLGAADEKRRSDAREVVDLVREVTGAEPRVWSSSIVGFGRTPYTTADGKEHEWFAVGLAPRKAALVLYGLAHDELLERLGPHTTGSGCVNLKRLDAVDREVLAEMVRRAWSHHRPE